MKNTIKLFGLIAMVAIIGFSTAVSGWCSDTQKDDPQLKITVTGIDAQYNGKFVFLRLDDGPSSSAAKLAWVTGTIANGSITVDILDYVTDEPYSKTGNYCVVLMVYENRSAVGGDPLWGGVISSTSIGAATSIAFSEFTRGN